MEIRQYRKSDEEGWLRCRVLAFLHTPYHDDVRQEKEYYESESIDLVAEKVVNGEKKIVGLLDVEITEEDNIKKGNIWNLAIHPDFQNQGIGSMMLQEIEKILVEKSVYHLEIWTRIQPTKFDNWYTKNEFTSKFTYWHIHIYEQEDLKEFVQANDTRLTLVSGFFHYIGEDRRILERFDRTYKCVLYEKTIKIEKSVDINETDQNGLTSTIETVNKSDNNTYAS